MSFAIRSLAIAEPNILPLGGLFAIEPSPENDLYIFVPVNTKMVGKMTVFQPRLETAKYVKGDVVKQGEDGNFGAVAVAEIFEPEIKSVSPEIIESIRMYFEALKSSTQIRDSHRYELN